MQDMQDQTVPAPPNDFNRDGVGGGALTSFTAAIPYDLINKIIGIAQTAPLSLATDPANLKLIFWTLGCLTEVVERLIGVGVMSKEDFANALSAENSTYRGEAGPNEMYDVSELDGLILTLNDANRDMQEASSTHYSQFGITTAITVISAISAIYSIWKMISPKPKPSDDHSVDSHNHTKIINRKAR